MIISIDLIGLPHFTTLINHNKDIGWGSWDALNKGLQ